MINSLQDSIVIITVGMTLYTIYYVITDILDISDLEEEY